MYRSTHTARALRRPLMVAAVIAIAVLAPTVPALAHVDLASSVPADGTSVSITPDVIELRFTAEADPAGDGIVLATADGTPIEATVTRPEPMRFLLVPVEPLANGVYGVLWTMRAGDAHPRSGTFTFAVDAPEPVVEEPEVAPTLEDADAPDPGGQAEVAPQDPGVDAPSVDQGVASSPPSVAQDSDAGVADQAVASDIVLDPVFDVPVHGSAVGEWAARAGRWLAMTGALVAIGAFVFAATSLIGTRREVEEAGYWVRRAGLLVILGTLIEWVGASMMGAGSGLGGLGPSAMVDALDGSFGIAVLLRVIGGLAMVKGTAIVASRSVTPVADAARLGRRQPDAGSVATLDRTHEAYRLDVHHERLAIGGIALVTMSYLFDGHTVTTSPTLVVRASSAVHVLAGGVWVGGILLMAWTLAARHRRREDLGAAAMVVRFSRVASVALVSVAVAGSALAVAILDTPSELVTTAWGRILVIKLLAVGAAAAIGAYNHFVTVPALESDPDDEEAGDRLRGLVRIEGAILLLVVVVTAVLVGAAS